ncbi:uncharacterized protein LOC113239514 isoform X2 [Hyposmocoma kahamanoa]|uniref:uncharacterized protein LOC113239514 isoform X2 n=1 Tax=Hyposmocoma kahamanoa TaxID=1477025 RepID=UPI000E6D9373|nr:uncharacterized protein LOC113239514 isoform X2 [Hyposmocoma kahamanoa]
MKNYTFVVKLSHSKPRPVMDDVSVDPLADYFKSWGLEMYINLFKEQAIDSETLQMLSQDDIKELIQITSDPEHSNEVSVPRTSDLPVLEDSALQLLDLAEPNSNIENEEPLGSSNTCVPFHT